MSADFTWASPGGVYTVPNDFRSEFESLFPGYRIRWSIRLDQWHIEQPYGRGALPASDRDHWNDDFIRFRDGYWLVMRFAPGEWMTCQTTVDYVTKQKCETSLKIPHFWSGELRCPVCVRAGRDGGHITGYWPFGSRLIEELISTDPLRGGIVRKDGKTRVRAGVIAEVKNDARQKAADKKVSDHVQGMDAVDYRWISGIPSSTGLSRRTISEKDLE